MASSQTKFATTLQTLRKKRGVTQEQLAVYLGVSPQAVSKWENGSYPEGDLLPRISEYFGVSISYLYGQEKETVSVEQQVLDRLKELAKKQEQGDAHTQYFDKMLDLAWAFQIGAWSNTKDYYERIKPEKNTRTASVITDDAGFGFFNLNKEREFFTLVREPEEGFASHIRITEQHREFFAFFGKSGALEIWFYLMTLTPKEYVTADTIAGTTGVALETVEKRMEECIALMNGYNTCLRCIDVVSMGLSKKAYGIEPSAICMFLSLLLSADTLVNPPCGYQMQIGMRGKSWLDREEVVKMLKDGQKNGDIQGK